MRLTDADALREKAHKLPNGYNWGWFHKCVDEMIDTAPTIDAVEVVRCKNCKHHEDEEPGMVYCPIIVGGWVSDDFFCGDGERRMSE